MGKTGTVHFLAAFSWKKLTVSLVNEVAHPLAESKTECTLLFPEESFWWVARKQLMISVSLVDEVVHCLAESKAECTLLFPEESFWWVAPQVSDLVSGWLAS